MRDQIDEMAAADLRHRQVNELPFILHHTALVLIQVRHA
jgi:hypothetical protein